MLLEPATHLCRQYVKPTAYLTSSHAIFHPLHDGEQNSHPGLWDGPEDSSLPLLGSRLDMTESDVTHPFSYLDMHGFHQGNCNPSFTKSMFATPGSSTLAADDGMLCWNSTAVQLPAETIEPGVAFRATIPSSPCYKVEASSPCYKAEPSSPYYKVELSTPRKTRMNSSAFLSSSPASSRSPQVVPSQYDVDDLSYTVLQQAFGEKKKARNSTDRLHRRPYERKRPVGSSSKSKALPNNSGMECPLVIEGNEHACSYPDCRKKFKRHEHKKRHEKSVHERGEHHVCWVPECGQDFSRRDNLKSHLRNTHSKRPGVRGNRYVATLDKNSEFYDPEWTGRLDKNGYPLAS